MSSGARASASSPCCFFSSASRAAFSSASSFFSARSTAARSSGVIRAMRREYSLSDTPCFSITPRPAACCSRMACCRSSLLISEDFRLPYAASTLACAAFSSRRMAAIFSGVSSSSAKASPGTASQEATSSTDVRRDMTAPRGLPQSRRGRGTRAIRPLADPSLPQPPLRHRVQPPLAWAHCSRAWTQRGGRSVPVRVGLHQPTQLRRYLAGLLGHRAPVQAGQSSRTAPSAAALRAAPRPRRSGSRRRRPPVPPAWDSQPATRANRARQGARMAFPYAPSPVPSSSALSAEEGRVPGRRRAREGASSRSRPPAPAAAPPRAAAASSSRGAWGEASSRRSAPARKSSTSLPTARSRRQSATVSTSAGLTGAASRSSAAESCRAQASSSSGLAGGARAASHRRGQRLGLAQHVDRDRLRRHPVEGGARLQRGPLRQPPPEQRRRPGRQGPAAPRRARPG